MIACNRISGFTNDELSQRDRENSEAEQSRESRDDGKGEADADDPASELLRREPVRKRKQRKQKAKVSPVSKAS